MVRAAGYIDRPDANPRDQPPAATPQRSRAGMVGPERDLHVDRLDPFAQPALVLHDLRTALSGGPGAERDGVPDYPDGDPGPAQAAGRRDHAAPSARSGKTDAGAGHGVGVLF